MRYGMKHESPTTAWSQCAPRNGRCRRSLMKTMDAYETPWISIPVPDRWTIGRQREWIFLRSEQHPEDYLKLMPLQKETGPAGQKDIEELARSSDFDEPEKTDITLGEWTGLAIRVRSDGKIQDRILLRSGQHMLCGTIVAQQLDRMRTESFKIIEGIHTKEANNAMQLAPRTVGANNNMFKNIMRAAVVLGVGLACIAVYAWRQYRKVPAEESLVITEGAVQSAETQDGIVSFYLSGDPTRCFLYPGFYPRAADAAAKIGADVVTWQAPSSRTLWRMEVNGFELLSYEGAVRARGRAACMLWPAVVYLHSLRSCVQSFLE